MRSFKMSMINYFVSDVSRNDLETFDGITISWFRPLYNWPFCAKPNNFRILGGMALLLAKLIVALATGTFQDSDILIMTEAIQLVLHFWGLLIITSCAIILGTNVCHHLHWRYQSPGAPRVGRLLAWPIVCRGQHPFLFRI